MVYFKHPHEKLCRISSPTNPQATTRGPFFNRLTSIGSTNPTELVNPNGSLSIRWIDLAFFSFWKCFKFVESYLLKEWFHLKKYSMHFKILPFPSWPAFIAPSTTGLHLYPSNPRSGKTCGFFNSYPKPPKAKTLHNLHPFEKHP